MKKLRMQGACLGCNRWGKVRLEIECGGEKIVRWVPCPNLSPNCNRGIALMEAAKRMVISGLSKIAPKKHVKRLLKLKQTPLIDFVERWNLKGSLTLCGGTGIGKSFSACYALFRLLFEKVEKSKVWEIPATCRDYIERSLRGFYWTTPYRVVLQKDSIAEAYRAGVLVLDDLGMEDTTRGKVAFLNDLINKRYEDELITIITANLTIDQLREKYGERFVDRLSEVGAVKEFKGVNMRAAYAKAEEESLTETEEIPPAWDLEEGLEEGEEIGWEESEEERVSLGV